MLADLGATVDKIEDTGGGDYLRHMPPHVAGESAAFHVLNRGKRSAVLDLKHPAGKAAFRRLVAGYDVLFDQFRPGVMARLGLGHAELMEANPRLVVCALTGYGQTGPLAQRAGHDIDYLARAGLLGITGPAGAPPQVPGFQLADVSGGMWCVVAILGALMERQKTGKGALLDIAMTDGVVGFAPTALAPTLAGQPARRGDEVLTGAVAPYRTYATKDGRYVALGALEPKFWSAFCAGVGLEVDMSALMPGPHQVELQARVAAIFAGRTRDEWAAFGAARDCCLEPVLEPGELADDALFKARGLTFELATPRGPVPQFRTPVTPKDGTPAAPPEAGRHTRAILREAGLSEAEVDELVAAGAARELRSS